MAQGDKRNHEMLRVFEGKGREGPKLRTRGPATIPTLAGLRPEMKSGCEAECKKWVVFNFTPSANKRRLPHAAHARQTHLVFVRFSLAEGCSSECVSTYRQTFQFDPPEEGT